MKKITRILIATLVVVIVFPAYSQDVFKTANVGIGKTNPSQKLDVLGNVQFSGALMPNGLPGATGNILVSGGISPATPTWLVNGGTGTVLSIGVGGVPTWVAPSSFGVTSINVNSPLSNSDSASAVVLNLIGSSGTILYGTGTASAFQSAAGTTGNLLLSAGTGAPTWLPNGSTNQVLTISGGVPEWASLANLTPGTGLTGSVYNGSAVQTFAVNYGSISGSAVQGNTTLTVTAGTGMSGGGTITLGSGGTVTLTNTGILSIGITAPIVNTGTTTAPNMGIQGVAANKGGILYSTGLATSAAFNTTGTIGNILLSGGTGTPTWLSNGASAGMVLTTASAGSAPMWVTPTTSATAWQLTGNSNTTSSTNFIGTTNGQDVVFKANNAEAMRISNGNNNVGIGTTTPNSASKLEIAQNYNGGSIGMIHLNSSGAEAGISFLENANGPQQYSLKDGDAGANTTWFAIHDETAGNQALTIAAGQNNGNGVFNSIGINQSNPQSVFDISYPGGDGTGNGGMTIENNSSGSYRLWVSDYNNSENYSEGGFEIWDNNNGADRFTIEPYNGYVGVGGYWNYMAPQNALEVNGSEVVGNDWMGYLGAPYAGLLVEGQTSIGTTSNTNELDVNGSQAVGSYAGNNTAPTNGLIVSGSVGLGTTGPANPLDVNGAVAVGTYAGTAAPANGLIVSGQVGVGTSTPDASAALDITSSSKGLLIPRMATTPTSPSQGLMYFNTTSGCFMFYNGSNWQSIACNCSPPAAAGAITGSASFCTGATGATYSVSPIAGASGYNWSIPTDATITAGWGTPSITVTFGSASGSISVAGTSTCGTGTSSTLAVTNNGASITGQPANASATPTSFATFTVTATGSSLTYLWQFSTDGGGSWSTVTNGAPYSGATTATLTVTNPTLGMSGYEYRCMVTGSCGSPATSNAATLTVCTHVESVPITLTNSQNSATSANLAVKIIVNFSSFAGDGENSNLNNVEFSTGGGGTGTVLYAWIESGTAPTSGTSTETVPTSSSTTGVVWVNLGSSTIAGSGTLTIYMTFMGSVVMTSTSSFTGEAPQWSGTYGQYDNGPLVFSSFYDNFAGTSLASKWTNDGSNSVAVNNGLTVNYSSSNWNAIYTNTFSSALNHIAESYCAASNVSGTGTCINASGTNGNGINNGSNGVDAQLCAAGSGSYGFGSGGSCTSAPNANATPANAAIVASTNYVFSFFMYNTPVLQLSYGTLASLTGTNGAVNAISSTSEVGLGPAQGSTGFYQWFRIRSNPPNGMLPGSSVGTYGCY